MSYGCFTQHLLEGGGGSLVLGVFNFWSKAMGAVTSEVLVLGVQAPKAASGEATFVLSAVEAKVGAKLF